MKAVLISIRPKWVELIADGQKTVEIRKSRPKLETPFRCYIYEAKGFERVGNDNFNCVIGGSGRGAVVGEFVCDTIFEIKNVGNAFRVGKTAAETNRVARASCSDFGDMHDYLGHKGGYGWHISALKMYDEPRKLSEFRSYNTLIDFEQGYPMPTHGIRRPPQSYMYVEELYNV